MRKMFTLYFITLCIGGYTQNRHHSFPEDSIKTLSGKIGRMIPGPVELQKLIPDSPGIRINNCQEKPQPKSLPAPQKIIFRCAATRISPKPLIVVDGGLLSEDRDFSGIDPAMIENIYILKSAEGAAIYGYRGANGVILILTKHSVTRRFIIRDSISGDRLPGATVLLTSKNNRDSFQFIANDSGVVETDRLKKGTRYQVTVSSAGYQTTTREFENGYSSPEEDILLARDIKACEEVVLGYTQCPTKRVVLYCRVSGMTITPGKEPAVIKEVVRPALKIYPNPVQKGGNITAAINSVNDQAINLRLLNPAGQVMLSEVHKTYKGFNRVSINTGNNWTAGVYFLQLLYENGQVAASEKIIIQ